MDMQASSTLPLPSNTVFLTPSKGIARSDSKKVVSPPILQLSVTTQQHKRNFSLKRQAHHECSLYFSFISFQQELRYTYNPIMFSLFPKVAQLFVTLSLQRTSNIQELCHLES